MKNIVKHLGRHYLRNFPWTLASITTMMLAIFTSLSPKVFDIIPAQFGLLRMIDDPYFAVIEGMIGTFGLVVSMSNINQLWTRIIMSSSLVMLWTYFSVGLILFDLTHTIFTLDIPLCFFMVFVLIHSARYPVYYEGKSNKEK